MLSEEEAKNIKTQIIQQIDSTFPEDKKNQAKQEVDSMGIPQLEEFLEKNNLVKEQGQEGNPPQQCIFCAIASGQSDSVKLDENDEAVAVLEINPISNAHTLVIPKNHISNAEGITEKIKELAKKVSEKIGKKLSPKEILISNSNLFGHEIINVLPVYENENMNSQRHQAKKEELENVEESLREKPEPEKIVKPKVKKIKEKLWLPKRIP